MSELIDKERLLKRTKFYNLPNGNRAIDEIDILHAPTVQAIPLDKVKQTREKISDWDVNKVMDGCSEPFRLGVAKGLDIASVILDKLIESEE